MERLIIVGASGHGRVVLDCARAAGIESLGFIDRERAPGEEIHGVPVLAREPEECAALREARSAWFVAVGDNRAREDLSRRIAALTQRQATNVVHPRSVISPAATLGSGVFIAPGVILNTDVRLADGVIVNTAASVDHDGAAGAFAQISPGCRLAGNVTLGARVFLGTGVIVIPGITIGNDAVIGAGAVVITAIPPGVTAIGHPARVRHS